MALGGAYDRRVGAAGMRRTATIALSKVRPEVWSMMSFPGSFRYAAAVAEPSPSAAPKTVAKSSTKPTKATASPMLHPTAHPTQVFSVKVLDTTTDSRILCWLTPEGQGVTENDMVPLEAVSPVTVGAASSTTAQTSSQCVPRSAGSHQVLLWQLTRFTTVQHCMWHQWSCTRGQHAALLKGAPDPRHT